MLDQQDLVGEWEVEQQSAITGDKSSSEHVKCRFSIVNAKAAFLDSQNNGQVGVGQSSETDALNVLDYEEFKECVALRRQQVQRGEADDAGDVRRGDDPEHDRREDRGGRDARAHLHLG